MKWPSYRNSTAATSARIRATTVTLELTRPDPVTTANLGYLLRNDENTNVRLAALDALRRFAGDPGVRNELIGALGESPPEAVRCYSFRLLTKTSTSANASRPCYLGVLNHKHLLYAISIPNVSNRRRPVNQLLLSLRNDLPAQ